MNTNTPETDAAWARWQYAGPGVHANFARKLERERDEARAERDFVLGRGLDAADVLQDAEEKRDVYRNQLYRICKEGFGNDDTIGLEPADDYVLRKLAEMRDKANSLEFRLAQEKHLNDDHEQDYLAVWKLIKQPNETVIQAVQRVLADNADMRQALSVRTVSCSQCNESARTIAEMRESIKDAHSALGGCLKYILRLPLSGSDAECETMDDAHHALRKLQHFLK